MRAAGTPGGGPEPAECRPSVLFTGVYGVYGDPKATGKSGHAYDVPDETWYLGLGVTAADEVLADLRAHLTE